jgi:hypothetical protein
MPRPSLPIAALYEIRRHCPKNNPLPASGPLEGPQDDINALPVTLWKSAGVTRSPLPPTRYQGSFMATIEMMELGVRRKRQGV